jgi:hypothetical protein
VGRGLAAVLVLAMLTLAGCAQESKAFGRPPGAKRDLFKACPQASISFDGPNIGVGARRRCWWMPKARSASLRMVEALASLLPRSRSLKVACATPVICSKSC